MPKRCAHPPVKPSSRLWWVVLPLVPLLLSGCAVPPPVKQAQDNATTRELQRDFRDLSSPSPTRHPTKTLEQINRAAAQTHAALRKGLEHKVQAPLPLAPAPPTYNRLDNIPVSLDMDNAKIRDVLEALAKATGMNLLVSPAVLKEAPRASIRFNDVPASTVLRDVLRIADLYGKVDGNVLEIEPYQQAIFHLDFLETNQKMNFAVGGDVLGSGSASGSNESNPITGSFNISGSGPTNANPYVQLNDIISGIVKGRGTYQLNPISGLLRVHAKPSAVRAVNQVVNDFKRIMGRQILLDARIVEVTLNNQFQAGINWASLRNKLAWSFGVGQVVSGTVGNQFLSLTVPTPAVASSNFGGTYRGNHGTVILNLLKQYGTVKVLSNPTIRAIQGQAALISVGTSESYVSKVTTTLTGTSTATAQTDVQAGSVFDGLMLGVVPFISSGGNVVSLEINPVQSSVDPSSMNLVKISDSASITLPQVALKEIHTVLKLHSGDTVLLGGLINKNDSKTRDAVPVLSELPLIGRAFKSNSDTETTQELVIILKVRVL